MVVYFKQTHPYNNNQLFQGAVQDEIDDIS